MKVWVHLEHHSKINDFQSYASIGTWNPTCVWVSSAALKRRGVRDSDVAHVSLEGRTVDFSFVEVLP